MQKNMKDYGMDGMDRQSFLNLAAVSVTAGLNAGCTTIPTAKRPDILFVMSDDHAAHGAQPLCTGPFWYTYTTVQTHILLLKLPHNFGDTDQKYPEVLRVIEEYWNE